MLKELMKARIEAFADNAIKQIQENIRSKGQTASGKTAASLQREWQGDTLVISGAGHVFALEFGRGPSGSGSASTPTLRERIRVWIDDKGINPTDISKDSLAFLIARSIHRKGTLLYQSRQQSGTLSEAINEQRMTELSKSLLAEFASVATSTLLAVK